MTSYGWFPDFVYPGLLFLLLVNVVGSQLTNDFIRCSVSKKSSIDEAAANKGVSRWRSDESSEDEDERRTNRESGASLVTRRRPRFSRK